MRNLLFFMLLCSFCACKKNSDLKIIKRDIVGTWEFEKFIGYPFDQQPLPPGNGRIIVLKDDGTFERKQHDTLIFRGSYSLRRKKDCHERNTDVVFSTDENSSESGQYSEIAEDKLLLSTPNCYQDGGTAYYRRLD